MVKAEHLLHVVRGRAVTLERVIADQVRRPLGSAWVHVDQHRRISLQTHDIGVTFQACQPGRVPERGVQVRRGSTLLRCPFADKNLRVGSAVVVVLVGGPGHRPGRVVEVIVNQIRHTLGVEDNSSRRDHVEVRIASLDGIVELGEPASVTARGVEEIFVANLHILERERSRVTRRRAVRPRWWWSRP